MENESVPVLLNPVRILSFATISFFYVYVLSFYNKAKTDWRFLEALGVLRSKLSDSKIVVENPNRKPTFSFCRRGEPSELATQRHNEILRNIKR